MARDKLMGVSSNPATTGSHAAENYEWSLLDPEIQASYERRAVGTKETARIQRETNKVSEKAARRLVVGNAGEVPKAPWPANASLVPAGPAGDAISSTEQCVAAMPLHACLNQAVVQQGLHDKQGLILINDIMIHILTI
jgi:hypothetical protein